MRILMISDHADPLAQIGTKETGGQNIYVMNIASLLAKLGMTVDVYTRWDRATKQEVVEVQPGFRVIRVKAGPKSYMPRDEFLSVTDEFIHRIKQRIGREKLEYDVIVSHYWYSGVIGLSLAQAYGLPQTHIYHSIGQMRFATLKKFEPQDADYLFYKMRDDWERRIAQESTSIISTSPFERDDIVRLFEVSPEKIMVIPVGVDTTLFRPYRQKNLRKRLGLPTDSRIILYAGRLEWRKGIETLVRAVGELAKKQPDIELYLIGGGSTKTAKQLDAGERERLHKVIQELDLKHRIRFLGARPQTQMAMYYAAVDVCAVPSYYEPFGIVPIESMASGTPVVASRTGGMQYTVEDGVTGLLAEPHDHLDLADKLDLVLQNGKAAYTEAARRRALDYFFWPEIARIAATHLLQLSSGQWQQTEAIDAISQLSGQAPTR